VEGSVASQVTEFSFENFHSISDLAFAHFSAISEVLPLGVDASEVSMVDDSVTDNGGNHMMDDPSVGDTVSSQVLDDILLDIVFGVISGKSVHEVMHMEDHLSSFGGSVLLLDDEEQLASIAVSVDSTDPFHKLLMAVYSKDVAPGLMPRFVGTSH
jgi:hypothetical protein